jgi:hypothetical protein
MKRLLSIFILVALCMQVSAYTIEIIPKGTNGSKFGFVIVKNNEYKPGQMAICFLHGLGECGDGSAAALRKLSTTGYFNQANDPQSFAAATDYFKFNIVAIQTASNSFYSSGEIREAYNYALRVLLADSLQIHLAGNSLGGFGISRESSKDPELPKLFSTISFFCMGPGILANSAKNLAASGRPIWMWTSADDHNKDANGIGTNSGTSFQVTDDLYAAIKAAGGNVWETKYLHKGHSAFTAVAGAWGAAKGQPGAWWPVSTAIATGLNVIKVTWYAWLMNNPKGSVKDPLQPYIPVPITIPPIPDSIPLRRPLFILFSDSTWSSAG